MRKVPKELVYIVLLSIFLLLLNLIGILKPIRGLFEKIAVIPIRQKIYETKRTLNKDLGNCTIVNDGKFSELKQQIAVLTEENKEQKRLLSVPLPKNWQFMTVKVISLENETLTINMGKSDGVKIGMVALTGNTYIGKVFEVSENMSKIKLPTFLEEKLVVKIISGENISGKGLLVGKGEGKMRVEQILEKENPVKGDLVTLDIEGDTLLVGKIEDVMQNKGEVFKTSQASLFFVPEDLNTIFLIKGKI